MKDFSGFGDEINQIIRQFHCVPCQTYEFHISGTSIGNNRIAPNFYISRKNNASIIFVWKKKFLLNVCQILCLKSIAQVCTK